MTIQLDPPIPVSITSAALPDGVRAVSRKGWCYAWRDTGIDGHRLWIVVLDETGEVVETPQTEIRVDANWSYGRRPKTDAQRRRQELLAEAFYGDKASPPGTTCPDCGAYQSQYHRATCPRRPV